MDQEKVRLGMLLPFMRSSDSNIRSREAARDKGPSNWGPIIRGDEAPTSILSERGE